MKRVDAITVSDSDSTEQNEPQPNDRPEATTTANNPTEDRSTEEQRPDDDLRQKEPSPEQQRPVPDNATTEPTPPPPHEEYQRETDAPTECNTRAPMNIIPSPDQVVRMEPNILNILDDE